MKETITILEKSIDNTQKLLSIRSVNLREEVILTNQIVIMQALKQIIKDNNTT